MGGGRGKGAHNTRVNGWGGGREARLVDDGTGALARSIVLWHVSRGKLCFPPPNRAPQPEAIRSSLQACASVCKWPASAAGSLGSFHFDRGSLEK